jgi:hypothetical protein
MDEVSGRRKKGRRFAVEAPETQSNAFCAPGANPPA